MSKKILIILLVIGFVAVSKIGKNTLRWFGFNVCGILFIVLCCHLLSWPHRNLNVLGTDSREIHRQSRKRIHHRIKENIIVINRADMATDTDTDVDMAQGAEKDIETE